MNLKLVKINSEVKDLTFPELNLLQREVKRVFEKENLYRSREYDYWGSITLSSSLFDYNLWKAPLNEETDVVEEIGHFCTLYVIKDDVVDYGISLSFSIRFID